MKRLYFLFAVTMFFVSGKAQIINFSDVNVKTKLLAADSSNQIAKNLEGNYFKIDSNDDNEIDQSEAFSVLELDISNANISTFSELSNFSAIAVLNCSSNQISNLIFSSLSNLVNLNCSNNLLQQLNLSANYSLEEINCRNNLLTSLNLRNGICESSVAFDNNSGLLNICLDPCQVIQIRDLINLYGYANCNGYYDCSFNGASVTDIVDIPDPIFKATLLNANSQNQIARYLNFNYGPVDTNNDLQIQRSEALNIYSLNLNDDVLLNNIQTLEGIRSFANIDRLTCERHDITSVDFSGLTSLRQLFIQQNNISSLSILGLTNLENLDCSYNDMNTLTVNNLPNLRDLRCSFNLLSELDINTTIGSAAGFALFCDNNQITTLNLANTINLLSMECQFNNLQSLNVTSFGNLVSLWCHNNQLTSLDLSNSPLLASINCNNNFIATLNFSGITGYIDVKCKNNLLESLFLKNGYTNNSVDFSLNPTIQYICVDEDETTFFQNKLDQYGFATTCNINSYCSFVPGGTFYTVSGGTKLDLDNNGCTAADFDFSSLKFAIQSGTTTGSIISDNLGNYSIPIQAGLHTITPILENPNYFTISPASVNVSFPTQTSPLLQNFCVSVGDPKPDLEVIIIPVIFPPLPGFDTYYKILYKNKGNITQSGVISLTYDDAVLDLISAPSADTSEANNLSWTFSNLLPLATGELFFTMNINSPMEIPAVNGGDILHFTATISSAATDVVPVDNTAIFNQIVLNSFDPNDKTCLEGNTITPEMVGKYLHYVIRFENTGTANAQNIVVKDLIDSTKFDINSLIPMDGSDPFVTRISNTTQVEFIFENIQLPFDDANNDGYVAFKIKTKPTLVLGDTFSNTASIYFDYNFPIITDPAVTTVALLANSDFVFENYFSIYPNPANTILNIETKKTIEVSSINIYNTLGQVVLVIPNAQQTKSVDVSSLKTGNYFLKIFSDQGSSSVKFVKM